VKQWVENYYNYSIEKNILSTNIGFDTYWQWFLYMTLQRHFKTIGIFCRLFLRDGKPGYLKDIPRTLDYVMYTLDQLQHKNLYNLLNIKIKDKMHSLIQDGQAK
jgi:aminoglycoside/choline kinase family phosphotransferase